MEPCKFRLWVRKPVSTRGLKPPIHAKGVWHNPTVRQPASRGPGRPPASKAADTRERILRAARAVFSEMGYDAATFQAIADRADLTRPAINHYFTGKRELYQEVIRQTNEIFVDWSARQSQHEVTLTGRMGAYIGSGLESLEEERSAAAFLVASILESQRHPDLIADDIDTNQFTRAFVDSAVRAGIESGDLRDDIDVDTIVELLVALLWGMTLYAGFVGSQERLQQIADQFLQLLGSNPWRRCTS